MAVRGRRWKMEEVGEMFCFILFYFILNKQNL